MVKFLLFRHFTVLFPTLGCSAIKTKTLMDRKKWKSCLADCLDLLSVYQPLLLWFHLGSCSIALSAGIMRVLLDIAFPILYLFETRIGIVWVESLWFGSNRTQLLGKKMTNTTNTNNYDTEFLCLSKNIVLVIS